MPSAIEVISQSQHGSIIDNIIDLVTEGSRLGALEENAEPAPEEQVPIPEEQAPIPEEQQVPTPEQKRSKPYDVTVEFFDAAKRKRLKDAVIRRANIDRLATPRKNPSPYDEAPRRTSSKKIVEICAPRPAGKRVIRWPGCKRRRQHGDDLMKMAILLEEEMAKEKLAKEAALRDRLKGLMVLSAEEQMVANGRQCPVIFCENSVDRAVLPSLPFSAALAEKLRASQLGGFLLHLNAVQRQETEVRENKLELARYEWAHDETIQERHNFHEVFPSLLERLVQLDQPIESKMVYKMMDNLRLPDCKMTRVDKLLKQLTELRSLSLAGNWLEDVPSSVMPRNLNSLELFCNLISNVTKLAANLPPILVHLGLGRNLLTNDSQLGLLKSCEHLCSLDLQDNDIRDLVPVLTSLQGITTLAALGLQGNPCS